MSSPATRDIVNKGNAKVIGAIYDVGTGRIKWLNESKVHEILKRVEGDPKRVLNTMASPRH
jgi:carbonic anhydrase